MQNLIFNPEDHDIILSKEEFKDGIECLARKIKYDYKSISGPIMIVPVLKGGMFLGTLLYMELQRIGISVHLDLVWIGSYKNNEQGKLNVIAYPQKGWQGYNIIIVEDILDSGNTLRHAHEHFQQLNPLSLEYCVLIEKKRKEEDEPLPFDIKYKVKEGVDRDLWTIGGGGDDHEDFRGLDAVYAKKIIS